MLTHRTIWIVCLISISLFIIPRQATCQDINYTNNVIDMGVVVSDIDRSLEFYQDVLGMKHIRTFTVNKEFGKKSGLTDGKAFQVDLMQLGTDSPATQWKLISTKSRPATHDSDFVPEQTGVQYITLNVKSLDPIVKRCREANVQLLGNTPISLSADNDFILLQDPDGIFIEIIGPLSEK